VSPGKPVRPQLEGPKECGLKAIRRGIRKLENFCDSSVLNDKGKTAWDILSVYSFVKRKPPSLRLLGIPVQRIKIPPDFSTVVPQTRSNGAELESSLERKCSRLALITPAQLYTQPCSLLLIIAKCNCVQTTSPAGGKSPCLLHSLGEIALSNEEKQIINIQLGVISLQ